MLAFFTDAPPARKRATAKAHAFRASTITSGRRITAKTPRTLPGWKSSRQRRQSRRSSPPARPSPTPFDMPIRRNDTLRKLRAGGLALGAESSLRAHGIPAIYAGATLDFS